MIHLIIGRQGSGKTLFLIKKAYESYVQGKTVYSNVHLNFPYEKLNYKDIIDCKLENAIVILDEVHLLLPSRQSLSKRNREICDSFLSMVRKKGLDVYGTTQTERKVDIRFREEKDFFYICKKYAYQHHVWGEVMHNQNLDSTIPVMIKMDVQETFGNQWIDFSFIANHYYDLYDTSQIIKIVGID